MDREGMGHERTLFDIVLYPASHIGPQGGFTEPGFGER